MDVENRTNAQIDGLRVPVPLYRHAAPSAPWPWMDFKRDRAEVASMTASGVIGATEGGGEEYDDGRWRRYPQSLFGNWTADQVTRCRIFKVMVMPRDAGKSESERGVGGCVVYHLDMFRGGKTFRGGDGGGGGQWSGPSGAGRVDDERAQLEALWTRLGQQRNEDVRLRAIFVERMSGTVLQMLGTRYNVEPFFFSSSANWIPSRYQEDVRPGKGDHITVVLPFVRVVRNASITDEVEGGIIDTQLPLHLPGGTLLLHDLLAFHMVRTTTSDTIISYHVDSALRRGSAIRLRSLLRRTGDSVYWSKLYQKCGDPTIVLLGLLWHAVYAWDEVFEVSYDYLNKTLEGSDPTTEYLGHTRELHKVRAHLICYQQYLRDFRIAVEFVKKTANPAMDAESVTEHERRIAAHILQTEADHLLDEIERLDKQREMQTKRVKNAMSLAISTVKNDDNKTMHGLTKATVKDAATMKQISYFTLVFLPPYLMATIFRMNVKEVNPKAPLTLAQYIEGAFIFTLCSTWLVIALQGQSSFHPGGRDVLRRLAWPVFYVWVAIQGRWSKARWNRRWLGSQAREGLGWWTR